MGREGYDEQRQAYLQVIMIYFFYWLKRALGLHLFWNKILFGYLLFVVLLTFVSPFLPVNGLSKFAGLGVALVPFLIVIPIVEFSFLVREHKLRQVFSCIVRARTYWLQSSLLSVILVAIVFNIKSDWRLALPIGIALAFGCPIHGSLSGSLFRRMAEASHS